MNSLTKYLDSIYLEESNFRKQRYEYWRKLLTAEMDRHDAGDPELTWMPIPVNRRGLYKILNDAGSQLVRMQSHYKTVKFKIMYGNELTITFAVDRYTKMTFNYILRDRRKPFSYDICHNMSMSFCYKGGEYDVLWLNDPMVTWKLVDKIDSFIPIYLEEKKKYLEKL